jgi:site-specific DNA-methyltransferase (adenine-specific)
MTTADTMTPVLPATPETASGAAVRVQRLVMGHLSATLYLGDCLEILASLTGVDAVITDPPYGVELTAKRAKQRNGETSERNGQYCHEDTPLYVKAVCLPAVMLCQQIASAVLVTPGTRNMHLYPIPDDMGCFYSAAGTGMGRWGFTCMQPILYYGKDPYLARGMGGRANSCGQTYPNDANEQPHPCAKPIAWAQWLVARGSLEGMTVCDPFMGSGTTGVACLRGNRNFVGIEKDPIHFATAVARLEREANQGVLL